MDTLLQQKQIRNVNDRTDFNACRARTRTFAHQWKPRIAGAMSVINSRVVNIDELKPITRQ
jgi:hypothetical protein